jgi:hypothetical protein
MRNRRENDIFRVSLWDIPFWVNAGLRVRVSIHVLTWNSRQPWPAVCSVAVIWRYNFFTMALMRPVAGAAPRKYPGITEALLARLGSRPPRLGSRLTDVATPASAYRTLSSIEATPACNTAISGPAANILKPEALQAVAHVASATMKPRPFLCFRPAATTRWMAA